MYPHVTMLINCIVIIDRYKYLQKPLEDSTLKGILQYINRFTLDQSDKLAVATGLIISQGLASAGVLNTLQKDHLAKDGSSALQTWLGTFASC